MLEIQCDGIKFQCRKLKKGIIDNYCIYFDNYISIRCWNGVDMNY